MISTPYIAQSDNQLLNSNFSSLETAVNQLASRVYTANTAPTAAYTGYEIGTLWIDMIEEKVYIYINNGIWKELAFA